LVQDYCPRDKVYVTIGNPNEAIINPLMSSVSRSQAHAVANHAGFSGTSKRQKRPSANILGFKGGPRHHTTTPEVPEALFNSAAEQSAHPSLPAGYSLSSASSDSCNMEACGVVSPASPPLSPSRLSSLEVGPNRSVLYTTIIHNQSRPSTPPLRLLD
uniref:Pecanex-like protein n=1 Tax=Hydatigena taeniaeformis TaxID=6205 RepID=A0A0R3XC31_HYDTA